MKKIIIIILLFSLFKVNLKAQYLYLLFKDGTSSQYDISLIRSITFSGINMNINKIGENTIPTPLNSIRYFKYLGATNALNETTTDLLKNDVSIYPNPSNSYIVIKYNTYEPSEINVDITDLNGKLIKNIFQKQNEAGNFKIYWDGNIEFKHIDSGIYICSITINKKTTSKKLIFTN